MELSNLVPSKLTGHVLPGFSCDIVWAIIFSPNQILYYSTLHLAIKHILQVIHITIFIFISQG